MGRKTITANGRARAMPQPASRLRARVGCVKLGHGNLQGNLASRTADHRSVLNVRTRSYSKKPSQRLRPSDSWSRRRSKGKARRYSSRLPKWMLPNRLNLDRSFKFAVGGRRRRGLGTCGLSRTCPFLSAQPRVAQARTSRRLARPLSSFAAPRGARQFRLQIYVTEFTNPARGATANDERP